MTKKGKKKTMEQPIPGEDECWKCGHWYPWSLKACPNCGEPDETHKHSYRRYKIGINERPTK